MKQNNIIQMIEQCQVEWKTLGEVAEIANNARKPVKASLRIAGNIPYYGANNIQDYVEGYTHDGEYVLIAEDGSASLENYSIQFASGKFWANNHVHVICGKSELNNHFLYHYLTQFHFIPYLSGGDRAKLTKGELVKISIPILPISLQKEIVRILDALTAVTSELTSELTLRQKQYQYYRDHLLSFGDDVEWKSLGEVAEIGTGSKNTNEAVIDGKYLFFVRSQEPRKINEYEFDEVAIITAGDGVGVGKVFHYVSGKYSLHQRAYRIVVKSDTLLPKFLFHFIRANFSRYLEKASVNSSVTSLRKPMFEKYKIPIPPLVTQQKIVEILDKFDRLTNSLSEGLPKEIEIRRKQYEYYREKLLTFPKQ
ncbi:restriction endonuclease subunit S [Pasteurella oralis]|uniref:restriction endonuclease subunit S n=1 Tax=Pasteurella oralis TaxID=1071947 RepID=UPI000C7A6643|nr:restriction endonuclease subunit S [Pasteurella oralis]